VAPIVAFSLTLLGAALVAVGAFQPWWYGPPDGAFLWIPVVLALATVALTATGTQGERGLTAWATAPAFGIVVLAGTFVGDISWDGAISSIGRGLWVSVVGGLILTAATAAAQFAPRDVEPGVAYEQRRAA